MRQKIKNSILEALKAAHESGQLPSSMFPDVEIEVPKTVSHGDFSTNIAMVSASVQKMAPRKIAEIILSHIDASDSIFSRTGIAGPGFINFFIQPGAWLPILDEIHEKDEKYGASEIGKGKKIQVEFVSANPTGPLHVGHGRGAAVGDSVASVLSFCGYDVQREYYINDSGRQIRTLGLSVYMRYKESFGENIEFPKDCYQGEYISSLAEEIREKNGDSLLKREEDDAILFCAKYSADSILAGIREDLKNFGITFDRWFSEQQLYDSGTVDAILEDCKNRNLAYEKDEALWFRTTDYGDEKDRVVVRANGQTTYFASDIAYHQDKYDRGFDKLIDVWGADHHGYIPRMSASIQASGHPKESFDVILVQLVSLLREGEPVAMSTRSGEFVTLKDVVDEVTTDAARFIFLTRHYESHLDFDLELAKKKTNDNPVYYVQYVHARISSILEKGIERGMEASRDDKAVSLLDTAEDIALMKIMGRFPEIVERSGRLMEPHRITYYLKDLASAFHSYYNKHKVLGDDPDLTCGRLYLVTAIRKVIRNGLKLLGVSAPEKM